MVVWVGFGWLGTGMSWRIGYRYRFSEMKLRLATYRFEERKPHQRRAMTVYIVYTKAESLQDIQQRLEPCLPSSPHLLLAIGTLDLAGLLKDLSHGLFQNSAARVDLSLSDGERRHETQSVGAAGDDEETALASRCDDGRGVFGKLHSEDQTPAADFLDDLGEALVNAHEVLTETSLFLQDVLLELGVRETTDDVVGEPGSERVAAEGGAVVAGDDLAGHVLSDNGGANGKAIAQGLGRGQDVRVGFSGQVAVSPEFSGTTKTTLDLIVDQDSTDLVAAVAQSNEELVGGDVDTPLALDRLDDDTASVLRDQLVDAVNVVVGSVLASRHHGRERLLVFGVRGHAEGAHGTAMEGAVEAHNLVLGTVFLDAATVLARELHSCLVRLASTVADECPACVLHAARLSGLFHEKLAKRASPRVVV